MEPNLWVIVTDYLETVLMMDRVTYFAVLFVEILWTD